MFCEVKILILLLSVRNKTAKTEEFVSVNAALGEQKVNVEFQTYVARKDRGIVVYLKVQSEKLERVSDRNLLKS